MPLQTLEQIKAAVSTLKDEQDVSIQSALNALDMMIEQKYGRHYGDGSSITYTTMFKVSTILLPRPATSITSPTGSILSESGYLVLPPKDQYMFEAGTAIIYVPFNDDAKRIFALQRGMEAVFNSPVGITAGVEDTTNFNTGGNLNLDTGWKAIEEIMNVNRAIAIG